MEVYARILCMRSTCVQTHHIFECLPPKIDLNPVTHYICAQCALLRFQTDECRYCLRRTTNMR